MTPLLVLAIAIATGGQDEPPDPLATRERFIICPGHPRCPSRAYRTGREIGVVAGLLFGGRRDFSGGANPAPRTGARLDFAPGEAALTPVSRERVEALARQMIARPRLDALVEGHADARGTGAANIELAGRRAEAAAAYLAERGIAADRITIISWGEAGAEPNEGGGDDGARHRNVVITLSVSRRPRP